MRFRNSLKLLMDNFKQVYRLLLAKFIIGLIATALCCAFVLPELSSLWKSTEVQSLVKNLKEFFSAIIAVEMSKVNLLKGEIFDKGGTLSKVTALLASKTLEITLTIVGCVLVYLVKRFAETVCHFTTGSLLNDKMTIYAENGYFTSLVANLGKASVYALVYVPIVFLLDVVTLGLIWLVLSVFPVLVALFVAVTVLVVMQSFKLTITGPWLPAMTADDKKLSKAMRWEDKQESKQQAKSFSTYLVSVYLVIIVNVVAALCTFGSALIITIPASYFFFICMQYVNYYTVKGKKYFLTFEQIEKNPDHGDSEHFFDYIGEVVDEDETK